MRVRTFLGEVCLYHVKGVNNTSQGSKRAIIHIKNMLQYIYNAKYVSKRHSENEFELAYIIKTNPFIYFFAFLAKLFKNDS